MKRLRDAVNRPSHTTDEPHPIKQGKVEFINKREEKWKHMKKLAMKTMENTTNALDELQNELSRLNGHIVLHDHVATSEYILGIPDYTTQFQLEVEEPDDSSSSSCTS